MKVHEKSMYMQKKPRPYLFLMPSHLIRAWSRCSPLCTHRPGQPVKQELTDKNAADKGAASSSCASADRAKMDELLLPWEEQLSGLALWEASGDLQPT